MQAEGKAPVIVKRRRGGGGHGGHHGGAWKVAYADFVTAMMAFFMLMWLLNATTEDQRKGLADYFSPTIAVSRVSGGGTGMFGGDSVFTEDTLAHSATGATHRMPTDAQAARGPTGFEAAAEAAGEGEDAAMEALEEALRARAGESLDDGVLRHVITRVTDEGLVVEIFSLPGRPLFEPDAAGGERPSAILRAIAPVVAGAFAPVRNRVAVEGHTTAQPGPRRADPAWALTQGRADGVRRLLEAGGLAAPRAARVTGHADRRPAVADPMAVRNERIEVILLRERPRG